MKTPITLEEQKRLELDILDAIDAFCKEQGLRYYLTAGTLLGAVRHKGFIPWDDDIDLTMPREDYERFFALFPQAFQGSRFSLISYRDQSSIYPFIKIIDNRTIVEETYVDPQYRTGVWVDIFPLDGIASNQPYNVNTQAMRKIGLITANTDKGTTPARRLLKKALKPLLGQGNVFAAAERLDKAAAATPIGKEHDLGIVVYGYGPQERMSYAFLDSCELEFEGKKYPAPQLYHEYLTSIYGDYMKLPPVEKQVPHACRAFWKED